MATPDTPKSLEMIDVLIVDDSFFIRKYLHHLVSQEPDMRVVGEASDGVEAVLLARKLKPRVITMDYHLPKKNGLEATAEIMLSEEYPPGILIVSAFSGLDGQAVLQSLRRGAIDYVEKPSGEISLDMEQVSHILIEKIRAVGQSRIQKQSTPRAMREKTRTHVGTSHTGGLKVVVIGASTGGPPLIEDILEQLPTNIGISVVIVQHMSKYFTSLFAERLDHVGAYRVKEVIHGDILAPNHVYVAPGDSYLKISTEQDGTDFVLELSEKQVEKTEHETDIDVTMTSAAKSVGVEAIGIILSGMGSDGAIGLMSISHNGGVCVVQDPARSVISSMPQRAINAVPDAIVVPVEDVVTEILRQVKGS